ncbi:S-layer homology domain-containing protein [Paenibacillus pasadenensis]|uniref:S-layer homology domain-containing protein n=1 Tax=Paenibacillus pasadenensis TaxID=217090 RepID=UPI00203B96D9|nr:S-layer homology domain-containing protein [Paenibacillus pasadenensis]MCM3749818.1 S-layer homology domain-containing protein [Paenibacillus pasadenensis]
MKKRPATAWNRRALSIMLIVSLLAGVIVPGLGQSGQAAAAAAGSSAAADISGHWAEKQLKEWIGLSYIKGFQDGSFRPDAAISRVEFIALVNRLFAYDGEAAAGFSDVSAEAWFAPQVGAAVQAGYVKGFPDGTFRPNKPLNRTEAAVMLAGLVPALLKDGDNPLQPFRDAGLVPGYGREALGALLSDGYMTGFPNGTVGPVKQLTRAEAVVLLDRIRKRSAAETDGGILLPAKTIAAAGIYGPATGVYTVGGDLTIQAPGTTLRNVVVKGNLVIGAEVGNGDVTLDHVTVLGSTSINGGGPNSIHLNNSQLEAVTVDRQDGVVRVVVGSRTIVKRLDVKSSASIQSSPGEDEGTGIQGVVISSTGEVSLTGEFGVVEIKSSVQVKVLSGAVANLIVQEGVASAKIELSEGVLVNQLELHGTTRIEGKGQITKALVDAAGVVFATKPDQVEQTERGEYIVEAPSIGGGGGGFPGGIGGGGGGIMTPPPTVTPPPTEQVEAAVSQPSTAGFLLGFGVPVANVTAADLSLADASGRVVALTVAGTLNEGRSYRIAAVLQEGEAYTVTLAKAGYAFGAPITFNVAAAPPIEDIAVTYTVQDAGVSGFRILFNKPVPGLQPSHFQLLNSGTGESAAVSSAASSGDGTSYRISAALQEGAVYSLSVMKKGYSFSGAGEVLVPVIDPEAVPVSASVYGIGESGFRVALAPAVAGLTASDFTLIERGAGTVPIAEAETADEGGTYAVAAALRPGGVYTLVIERSGFSFGAALEVTVPGDRAVTPSVADVSASGFTVALNQPVPGLTAEHFNLLDRNGAAVDVDLAVTADAGSTYVISAKLVEEESYSLLIQQTGYTFGAPLSVTVPAAEEIQVHPTVRKVRTYGFIVTLDQAVPDLDSLNFRLQNSSGVSVSIDMLNTVVAGKEFEVWAALDKNETYELVLDKEGYTFAEPLDIAVQPEEIAASAGFLTRSGFQLKFQQLIPNINPDEITLQSPSGSAVHVDAASLGQDGLTLSVKASLAEAGGYSYRIDLSDGRFAQGTITVPELIELGKYTAFNGYPGGYTGLTVQFGMKLPGLQASAFELLNANGETVAIDSAVTSDEGGSYVLSSAGRNAGGPFTLSITAPGYSFGPPAKLVNATLNLWNAGRKPTQFMAGLNPGVANLTKHNFTVKDAAGNAVAVTDAVWDSGQRIYVVTFDGSGGQSYFVSVQADGYDFGAPKKIHVYSQNAVVDASYTGFTLVMSPPLKINTQFGFKLKTAFEGTEVPIGHVVMNDDAGASYAISAALKPGYYSLELDADTDKNIISFEVPVVATVSVDEISNNGLTAKLSYAVDGLDAASFVLLDTGTGEQAGLSAAVTADGGKTYRLLAQLPGGSYRLKLNGHLPAEGVEFEVAPTTNAGATTISGVTHTGFELRFEHPVPGLLPAHIFVKDSQGRRLSGLSLSTADGGQTYGVRVALMSNADYTVELVKEFIVFQSPVSFHVNRTIAASVADVTKDGYFTLKFSPAFPEIENYLGLSITDAAGTVYYPNLFESEDGGTSYRIGVPGNQLKPGHAYTIQLNKDEFAMSPLSFMLPPVLSVVEANASVLRLALDAPVPGLGKRNFIVKNASGESVALASAATADGGASYELTGSFTGGQTYTVQIKPDVPYQINEPVSFPVSKNVTAAISNITVEGFKVQFGAKVAGLTARQVILLDPNGNRLPEASYSLYTADNGLTYRVTLNGVMPGKGYSFDLARDEFKLAAPVAFDITPAASLHLVGAVLNKIIVSVSPLLEELTAANFALFDSKGRKVAFTLEYQGNGSSMYNLLGQFDPEETFTLQANVPGYLFGTALTIGFKVSVDTVVYAESQKGFKLAMMPAVPGLAASDITITDDEGGTVPVQSLIAANAGGSYTVLAPLTGGKTYSVAIADKGPYRFGTLDSFTLNALSAFVDGQSVKGFTLNVSSPIHFAAGSLLLTDDEGRPVRIATLVSSDGGRTYEVGASLTAGAAYSLSFNVHGYDAGAAIPVFVQPVNAVFEGMESGSSSAFTIRFDHAVPDMRPSDFRLQQEGFLTTFPAENAVTEDGGYSYKVEANFYGAEQYTVILAKEGYDFGEPLVIDVPVVVRTAVLNKGASFVEIGLSPSVPGLAANNYIVKDSTGLLVSVSSVVAADAGAVYRIMAPFNGGETYTISLSLAGYNFGDELEAQLPSAASASIGAVNEQGMTIMLSPAIGGLQAEGFIVRDSEGQSVTLDSVTELSGGAGYRLEANLEEGASYTVTLAAAGYDFGSPLAAVVPVPIGISYGTIDGNGLTVKLSRAVSGLSAASFKLLDAEGEPIAIASAAAIGGGEEYALGASLLYGAAYSLSISREGFDFGAGLPFTVLRPIASSVEALSKSGFTLRLQTAVAELKTNAIMLTDSNGEAVTIDSLTTADGGVTYRAAAKLTEGAAYRLALSAQGYDFGPSVHLDVLPMLELTAAGIHSSGFTLSLSAALPGLSPASVRLTGPDGIIALNGGKFYDVSPGTADAGKAYYVRIPIEAGQTYTLALLDPAQPTDGPLEVMLPIAVSVQVTETDVNGIKLKLGQTGILLEAGDVKLATAAGEPIAVTAVVPGSAAGEFMIQAPLVEGGSYTLRLSKKGYDFGAAAEIYAAYRVTGSISGISENGFTLSLSAPVADLSLTLLDAGVPVALDSVTTMDYGATYRVTANLSYNKEFKLRLNKSGYEFGGELSVNHISAPPQLIDASTNESGTEIMLTFDKPLANVTTYSSFSVKFDGRWQSSVAAALMGDNTRVKLTWTSSGQLIGTSSAVAVAYTGVNRVKARNGTYLATFNEVPVANTTTLTGFAGSYVYLNDAATLARVFHNQYGKTAIETARLLRDSGFKAANYYRAVYVEYGMEFRELAPLLYAMDADALTVYEVYKSLGNSYTSFYLQAAGQLLAAGYTTADLGPAWRKLGIPGRELSVYLKNLGVSAGETVRILKLSYSESEESAAGLLVLAGYGRSAIAGAIQAEYGLSQAAALAALAAGKLSAGDAAATAKELYGADAVTAAGWLSKAGYPASEVGGAIAQQYSFASAAEAIDAFFGAGFTVSYTYALLRREYAQTEAAGALLDAGVSARETAEAVKSAGDGASVIISAMKLGGYDTAGISILVQDLWLSAGVPLSDVLSQFAASGFTAAEQVVLLREQFGADIGTAIAALYPGFTFNQRNGMLKYLLDGGYDSAELAKYYLKQGMNRYELFRQLRSAGRTSVQSVQSLQGALVQLGEAFAPSDAVQLFYRDYNYRYEAADVLNALRTAFAGDPQIGAAELAAAMSNSQLWEKLVIGKALVKGMGVTMQDWVELERTGAFSRFGCPCDVGTIVKDTRYLFTGSDLPDITVAMSLSSLYTLDSIIEGTINLYPSGGVRANAMPYLMSSLKNAGYSFEEVAAAFDGKGWSEWIAVFSKYGIAASDVVAYLDSKGLDMEQILDKLSPYSLRDRALVLRESYRLDAGAAAALLLQRTNEDQEDISRAVAWAYGGDPVALWIATLRAQGASASSVINTLAARYRDYWDSQKVGPALIQGGFSQEEVMKGLLIHANARNNLQETIRLLQSLYGQQQVTIAQLLSAGSIQSPEAGLQFLQRGGYKLPDIARALKDYYGLTAGQSAKLLTAAYPNSQSMILSGLASVYGQTVGSTVTEALQEKGITEVNAALDYLWNAGFSPKEIAAAAKDSFGQSVGQAALIFQQKNFITDWNVLITTMASVYGESVEKTIRALLVQQGRMSFSDAITFVFQARFSLSSSIKLAKTEYGLSSGDALHALTSSMLYREADIIAGINDIYQTSARDSIIDSLTAQGLVTLRSAVLFLLNMKFDLNGMVRVGKEHYGLEAGETAAELLADGTFGQNDIQNAVAYVYGQTLTQTALDTLTALGITGFGAAVPQLKTAGLTLPELVLAGKQYYGLSAGKTTYDLLQSGLYRTPEILAAVAELYGKPTEVSLEELLRSSGIATIGDAAPYLRSMGYSLQDVVEISKGYYGNSALATAETLNALQFAESSIVEWTIQQVYDAGNGSADGTPQALLQEAGITDIGEAIAHLWAAGFPLYDIVKMLKEYNGKSAAETAELLLAAGSFDASALLSGISAVYGADYDSALIEAFKSKGVFASADNAALQLSRGGYRLSLIAEMLKKSYGKTEAEAKALLGGLGIYAAEAVQAAVDGVYFSVGTSSGTLQQVLDLYGITTAEGAAALLHKQNAPVADIVQYMKDAYRLGADEAMALLAPYYKGSELGLAVTLVYYSGTNIAYLAKTIPDGYAGSPGTVANYMKSKFTDTDIVLALKVIFNLDALGIQDAITSAIMPAERVRKAVTAVFGNDPLLAYLQRMKDRGANANDISAELEQRGLLELAPAQYLIDTLLALGYDNASILKMRYQYFNVSRRNAGTEQEQGVQLAALGMDTPSGIVQLLRKWSLNPYQLIVIIQAGLPNAPIKDVALALREHGYSGSAIFGALNLAGEEGDSIAAILKQLGLSAGEAVTFLRNRSSDEEMLWLVRNGYEPREYLQYRDVLGDNTIAVLRQQGMSANEIAKLLVEYKRGMGYYSIAKALYEGGFTAVSDVAGALITARYRPVWIPGILVGIGGWTLKDVAQGMLDSGLISLVELVDAIQMANGGVLKQTYTIIRDISGKEQEQFYDGLDSTERKLLDNKEIAMIIAVSALRNASINLDSITNQLKVTETIQPEDALKVLIVSGVNAYDSAGSVWDVYRDYIGAMIVIKMLEKAAGNYISDFKNYYKLVKLVARIVYKLTS